MPTGLSLPKTLQFCGDGRRPIKHASVRFPSLLTLLAPLAGVTKTLLKSALLNPANSGFSDPIPAVLKYTCFWRSR